MKKTVMVIDDELSIRAALRRTLQLDGYTVQVAAEPAEAFALLAADQPDLILCDQMMPNMVGTDFFEIVRDRHPLVGRVMLTACPDADTVLRAINDGAVHRFVRKPWDDIELKVTVHAVWQEALQRKIESRMLSAARRQLDILAALESLSPIPRVG